MVTLTPIKKGYIPVNSNAAASISGPNYDEFQSDLEIFDILQKYPYNILSITMPHCAVDKADAMLQEGSEEALIHSVNNLKKLYDSEYVKTCENFLWIYEIVNGKKKGHRQMGIGGFAKTSEIRTDKNPDGTIIRNEGIKEEKMRDRVALISRQKAFFGVVNNALEDKEGRVMSALEEYSQKRKCHYEVTDEAGNLHRSWIVTDQGELDYFVDLVAAEEVAFVADGNHRSAAAAALGYEYFLTVFFPMNNMGLSHYNRLVNSGTAYDELKAKMSEFFHITELEKNPEKMPQNVHDILVYHRDGSFMAVPKLDLIQPKNAVEEIDAHLVQKYIFDGIFKITNTVDKRINYVGGNKDIEYIKKRVDEGEFDCSFMLAPVNMEQFAAVCKQNLYMPPKSTWFEPKIRIGLVIAEVE